MEALVDGSQPGAVKKGGTEFPMFRIRLFLQWAADRRVSAALLFGGMKKAFYSVILESVLGPMLTAGEGQIIFQWLGMEELRKQTLMCDIASGHGLLGTLPLPSDICTVVI